jgi:hypothetical protein
MVGKHSTTTAQEQDNLDSLVDSKKPGAALTFACPAVKNSHSLSLVQEQMAEV